MPSGSRGFVELSGMDTHTHHVKEHRRVCAFMGKENGFTERQKLNQSRGTEFVFVKCELVYLFGHLKGPPLVSA